MAGLKALVVCTFRASGYSDDTVFEGPQRGDRWLGEDSAVAALMAHLPWICSV